MKSYFNILDNEEIVTCDIPCGFVFGEKKTVMICKKSPTTALLAAAA